MNRKSPSPLIVCAAVLIARVALCAQSAEATTRPTESPYLVSESGPHHRVWQRLTTSTNETGQVSVRTNRYTELATGLNYQNPATGFWEETREEFEIAPDGTAEAHHGPHRVILSPNINSPVVVDMESPARECFRSRIVGLYYFDAASGKSVQLARIKNAVGELVPPNQVVYRDAFAGGVTADVRYTYAKVGFEQDVIITSQPAPPEDFGFDPVTTRLEVWTHFVEAPTPSKCQSLSVNL